MRNGCAFRRPLSVPLTDETVGGYSPAWPTPTARDWRSGKGRKPNGHTPQLTERIEADAGPTMRLNPDWVERLMGWPDGWTDLPPTGPATGSTECPESPTDENTE